MTNKSIEKQKKRAAIKQHVARKLKIRLRLFALIITILLAITIFKVLQEELRLSLAIIGLLIGVGLGILLARMFKISWSSESQTVVARLDLLGFVLLLVYIAIDLGRSWIFGHWIHGVELNAFCLVFLSGMLIGRFASMARKIEHILMGERKF